MSFFLSRSLSFSSLSLLLSLSKNVKRLSPGSEADDPAVQKVENTLALEDRGGLVVPLDEHRGGHAHVEGQEVGGQRRDAQRREVLVVDDVTRPVIFVDKDIKVVCVGRAVDRRVGRRDLEGPPRGRRDRIIIDAVLFGTRLDCGGAVVAPAAGFEKREENRGWGGKREGGRGERGEEGGGGRERRERERERERGVRKVKREGLNNA